jgi:hypothetical protein
VKALSPVASQKGSLEQHEAHDIIGGMNQNGSGSTKSPTEVTGRIEPLPTEMEWGWKAERGGERRCYLSTGWCDWRR